MIVEIFFIGIMLVPLLFARHWLRSGGGGP